MTTTLDAVGRDGALPELTGPDLDRLVAYWNAANYLTVAQIYLLANPLLREPLIPEHIKPRLLGHWGTSPALNLIYAHLNRLVSLTGQEALYVAGPGHGGPALVANTYLEGTYSEIYPQVSADEAGLVRLVRQFSTPGGIPSHVSVPTPGSIHEGGELGYALAHAFGAAFDHPDLLVAAVVGDGEAETGPLEGSWKGVSFLNPARDGAVLPILNLNQYKIANPTVLGRRSREQVSTLLTGHGYQVLWVEGDDVPAVHRYFADALATAHQMIRRIQAEARAPGATIRETPRWPAIVLRTPKGWTGPHEVDGVLVEGTFRAHQVPLAGVRDNPAHLAQLDAWLRSYRPEELFDDAGRLVPDLAALAPRGRLRLGATTYANGGLRTVPLTLPDWRAYALPIDPARRGADPYETTRPLGELLRDIYRDNPTTFRVFSPDELTSNRLGAILEVTDRCMVAPIDPRDDRVSPEGRAMEVLSEHLCEGWLEAYTLTGRHGLFATYEAFAMVSASMLIQHAKWLQEGARLAWRAPVPSLNVLLTSTCWRNDHNGFSHQGPGLIDTAVSLSGEVVRVWLPPDANSLLSVADHCLRSRGHVNLLVADKQPHLQYLTTDEAAEHAARGGSVWDWAGTETRNGRDPDIVLAGIGDVPTMEILAAAELLRRFVPSLTVRVVNIIDLMALLRPDQYPHGFSSPMFRALFTNETDVVVGFHGYSRAVHQLLHGRTDPQRFHVRGFMEQGTTTTPFDMLVRNNVSRYHLARLAVEFARTTHPGTDRLVTYCEAQLERHHAHVREHFEDLPEIRDWVWGGDQTD
ncbi:putative phosphoketolase [Frankia sp. AiPs1]|uniref:phosphoketolase family protein n=1 Tax=Frankia sp. AiPa1 TaxID=573492 RepID=UPI00202B98CD|nr:phosphoketolase family protein [Frankia sp. AiPa1]MCL9758172.1 phosphoketolase family protein [Frankia sp. AiPa1]